MSDLAYRLSCNWAARYTNHIGLLIMSSSSRRLFVWFTTTWWRLFNCGGAWLLWRMAVCWVQFLGQWPLWRAELGGSHGWIDVNVCLSVKGIKERRRKEKREKKEKGTPSHKHFIYIFLILSIRILNKLATLPEKWWHLLKKAILQRALLYYQWWYSPHQAPIGSAFALKLHLSKDICHAQIYDNKYLALIDFIICHL